MGNEMFNEEQLAYAADLAIQSDERGKAIERCIVTLNRYGHEVTDDVSETIDHVCTAFAAAVAERDRLREILRRIASMDQPDTCVDCSTLYPGDGASWCWFCTAREALVEVKP